MVLPNLCYVFVYNFYKQHLLQVQFYRGNEKNRDFHLIPKTPFQWMNPKVIGSYTFKTWSNCFVTSMFSMLIVLKTVFIGLKTNIMYFGVKY